MKDSIVSQYILVGKINALQTEKVTYFATIECLARDMEVSHYNLKYLIGFDNFDLEGILNGIISGRNILLEKKRKAVRIDGTYYKMNPEKPMRLGEVEGLMSDILEDSRHNIDYLKKEKYLIQCRNRRQKIVLEQEYKSDKNRRTHQPKRFLGSEELGHEPIL